MYTITKISHWRCPGKMMYVTRQGKTFYEVTWILPGGHGKHYAQFTIQVPKCVWGTWSGQPIGLLRPFREGVLAYASKSFFIQKPVFRELHGVCLTM